jgi:hypothetical protein
MLEAEGTLLGSGSANATHLHDTMNTVAFTSASTGGQRERVPGPDRARAAAFLTHFASRAARRRRKGAPGRGVVHGHPEIPLWQPRGRRRCGRIAHVEEAAYGMRAGHHPLPVAPPQACWWRWCWCTRSWATASPSRAGSSPRGEAGWGSALRRLRRLLGPNTSCPAPAARPQPSPPPSPPRSSAASALGLLTGLSALVVFSHYHGLLNQLLVFNSASFFTYLLPPVIFYCGVSVEKNCFFKNLPSILLFGILGTFISFSIIACFLYGFSKLEMFTLQASGAGGCCWLGAAAWGVLLGGAAVGWGLLGALLGCWAAGP